MFHAWEDDVKHLCERCSGCGLIDDILAGQIDVIAGAYGKQHCTLMDLTCLGSYNGQQCLYYKTIYWLNEDWKKHYIYYCTVNTRKRSTDTGTIFRITTLFEMNLLYNDFEVIVIYTDEWGRILTKQLYK